MKKYYWKLIVINKVGVSVEFFGPTKKECLANFALIYDRKGFSFCIQKIKYVRDE